MQDFWASVDPREPGLPASSSIRIRLGEKARRAVPNRFFKDLLGAPGSPDSLLVLQPVGSCAETHQKVESSQVLKVLVTDMRASAANNGLLPPLPAAANNKCVRVVQAPI